ncbi:MAG TPA: ABC transporter permease [Flavisolibacter sp.]|jgi:ABC-type antimicrobial peptide transport system permease subunit|nr:ABC transporter permease [Flavisolibacter sp.]
MFRSYLKIAWRNIWKNKAFSATNLLGLSIGMTCTMLILLWVQDELSWDKFHPNHKNVYHVMVNRNFNGEINTDLSTPFPLSASLKQSFPEVKNSSLDNFGGEQVLKYNETILKRRGYSVYGDYFNVFQWTFLKGNAKTALSRPDNIVLTASAAKALFGNEEAIGKVVKLNNENLKTVSGVVKDPPSNSTVQFSFLLPYNPSDDYVREASNDWVNAFTECFVEVAPGTDIAALNKKISQLANARAGDGSKFEYFLHPMEKWRLYSDFRNGINTGGMISYVRLFSIIAIIILLIACVNFMNLSTAKSEKRAKEVGIRKTLGSAKKQLILQFYSESMIFALLSFLLAITAVVVLLPFFNTLVDKQLSFPVDNPVFWLMAAVMITLTGFVAGSYPALYLSSFNPIKVLKGSFLPGKRAAVPRKVLVVLQFGVSLLLISSTILVYQQVQHVKNRDIGYNTNNLLSIPSSADANRNADVIKNELLQANLVSSVTRTFSPITEIWNFTPAPDWKGKPQNTNMIMAATRADAGFVNTIGARLLKGRDFTTAPVDSSALILNKAAVNLMQLKDPIGTEMRYGNRNFTVIGVTDDVVMTSPYAPVQPMMVFPDRRGGNYYVMRLKEGVKPQEALPKIEAVFKKYNPEYPFEYRFVDQEFNRKFVTEDLISRLSKIFAGLAIFICCLGLSGLASFTIERRFKEIGIRKVLGASVQQLLYLISKEFLLLVLLSVLISIPVTWWLLNNWLQNYEYRINISIWLFAGSCASVLLLTLVIVWLNAARAATANPAKSLRTE